MRIVAMILNFAALAILIFICYTEALWDMGVTGWVVSALLAGYIGINIIALKRRPSRWLMLYFTRKAAEEKRKILEEKQKIEALEELNNDALEEQGGSD